MERPGPLAVAGAVDVAVDVAVLETANQLLDNTAPGFCVKLLGFVQLKRISVAERQLLVAGLVQAAGSAETEAGAAQVHRPIHPDAQPRQSGELFWCTDPWD